MCDDRKVLSNVFGISFAIKIDLRGYTVIYLANNPSKMNNIYIKGTTF